MRISPENHYAQLLLVKAGLVKPGAIVRAGVGTLVYAAMEMVEGVGLWKQKRWAEFLVVGATGLFVPEEFLALIHQPDLTRASILLLNLIVLIYVARQAFRHRPRRDSPAPQSQ